ncbi:MAG: PPC domain-containing DNA-binding protein [Chloroflexaceae bacterium]
MQAKLISESGEKTFALIFDPGEEVVSGIRAFAQQQNLAASRFTALGAFSDAMLGFFDMEQKDYIKIPVKEQVEVLTLVGNIALHQGMPKIHAHVVLGKTDGTAHGGHLLEAHVRPTLEVVVVEAPRHLQRQIDEATGLPLLNIREDQRV